MCTCKSTSAGVAPSSCLPALPPEVSLPFAVPPAHRKPLPLEPFPLGRLGKTPHFDLMLRAQDSSPGALLLSVLPGLAISLFPETLGWVDSGGGISFPAGTLWDYRAVLADPRCWGFGIQPLLRPSPSPGSSSPHPWPSLLTSSSGSCLTSHRARPCGTCFSIACLKHWSR